VRKPCVWLGLNFSQTSGSFMPKQLVFLVCVRKPVTLPPTLYTPEYQYAHADHQIRHERADRRHLDELFEIEHGRQQAWKTRFDDKYSKIIITSQNYCAFNPSYRCRLRKSLSLKQEFWFFR
jgi:hypothetical protein